MSGFLFGCFVPFVLFDVQTGISSNRVLGVLAGMLVGLVGCCVPFVLCDVPTGISSNLHWHQACSPQVKAYSC